VANIYKSNILELVLGIKKKTNYPSLTDRIKRRKWCKERLNWSVEEWRRVIFSDESNFQVFNRKSKVMVKRLGSDKYDTKFCYDIVLCI
jgi:hypothetical protein